ncbi:MAG TPA: 2OG-Fe(II) oxygenase [Hyphomonadaceae bacterium]|nr:2OG-Fe(II) oxygenase [Hyphomonadaceae bacterium]
MTLAQSAANFRTLNVHALERAAPIDDPYRHVVADGVLSPLTAAAIRADFPETSSAGFLAADDLPRRGAYDDLLHDLESEDLARLLTRKLGLELENRPRLITVRRWSRAKDGRIHTDSESKIATMLVYLNETWGAQGGAIRVLRSGKDFGDYVREVPPVEGNVFAFRRSDASWHGHLPFKGERLVVQLTYLVSAEAAGRKRRNAGVQGMLKRIFERAA